MENPVVVVDVQDTRLHLLLLCLALQPLPELLADKKHEVLPHSPTTVSQSSRTAGLGISSQPPRATASGQNLAIPVPTRNPLPPQTPARRVADRLAAQLGQQTAMASPGPREYDFFSPGANPGDSSDSDDFPQKAVSLNSDDEGEALAPSPDLTTQPAAPGRHRRVVATLANSAVDAEGYAWIDEKDLVALNQEKTADLKYFFGQRAVDKSVKCRLCPKVYSSGSSLTTRRNHLQSHADDYDHIISKYKLPNKLPAVRRKQREQNEELRRAPFSIAAPTDQLVKVIVSNDLSINLIYWDYKDAIYLILLGSPEDGGGILAM
ncbi:hypothetical protein B0H13DRAFT_1865160 [Mycena leptocephala]|nr:hypothetical protein B0H13DRAFT_1865160 [Mycena leptocephala]